MRGTILRMHALRPVVHALLRPQLEDLPVFGIDVAQRARRVGVIDRDRGVVEQRQSERGVAGASAGGAAQARKDARVAPRPAVRARSRAREAPRERRTAARAT